MEEGHEQMDYALDKGVNFFDVLSLSNSSNETQGKTENALVLGLRKLVMKKIILATKVAGRSPRLV